MSENKNKHLTGESRREFLRKSAYAAYATPVIVSMLVNKANAAKSWNPGRGRVTETGSPPPSGSAPPANFTVTQSSSRGRSGK